MRVYVDCSKIAKLTAVLCLTFLYFIRSKFNWLKSYYNYILLNLIKLLKAFLPRWTNKFSWMPMATEREGKCLVAIALQLLEVAANKKNYYY